MPNGMYRWMDARGNEIISKNPPPASTPTPNATVTAHPELVSPATSDVLSAHPELNPGGAPVPSVRPWVTPNAASVSDAQNLAAGAGKAVVDTGRGSYQLGAAMGHAAGLVSDDKMAEIHAAVDEAKKTDQPLMDTTAGKIGYVGGTVAETAPLALAGILPTGILGSAGMGGVMGGLQPVTTGESRLGNIKAGAIAGAAGAGLGKVLGAVARPLGTPSAQLADDVSTLAKEGIPLSASQVTGSKLAQHLERASDLAGSDAGAEFNVAQRTAFNRAVLKRIGVDDPSVTAAEPDVLSAAKNQITGVMDDVASRNTTPLDTKLQGDIAEIKAAMPRRLQQSEMGPLQTNIDDIVANAKENGGALDGTFVQKLNSALGDLSADPKVAPLAGQLREAVQDATARAASPEDVAALAEARQQYRALKQIENAVDPATGNISVLKLMGSLSVKANRNQALYGKGDQSLMSLAKAAKRVIPDTLGNSGTAERAVPALTAAETLGSGEPVKAAAKLASGMVLLNSAGKALRGKPVMGGTTPVLGNYLVGGFGRVGSAAESALQSPAVRSSLIYGPGALERANKDATPQ
jgi:hypothetical protein